MVTYFSVADKEARCVAQFWLFTVYSMLRYRIFSCSKKSREAESIPSTVFKVGPDLHSFVRFNRVRRALLLPGLVLTMSFAKHGKIPFP
jgi:hypothetical protein